MLWIGVGHPWHPKQHGCINRWCACTREFSDKMCLQVCGESPYLKPMSLWVSFFMFLNKEFNYDGCATIGWKTINMKTTSIQICSMETFKDLRTEKSLKNLYCYLYTVHYSMPISCGYQNIYSLPVKSVQICIIIYITEQNYVHGYP